MSKQPTVLLVDDEDNDAILIKRALTKAGVPALFRRAKDGEQAIAYLKGDGEFHDRNKNPLPEILILDLKMPRKNGFDVLRWLRTHPPAKLMPVVVFTSSQERRDVAMAYDLGANSYMVKPNSFDDLIKMVEVIYSYWVEYNVIPYETSEPKCVTKVNSRKVDAF